VPKENIVNFKSDTSYFLSNPILLYVGQLVDNSLLNSTSHVHTNSCEILYIIGGSGYCIINNKQYAVGKGDVVVYNKGDVHEEHSSSEDPIKSFYCGMSNVNINGNELDIILPENAVPVIHAGNFTEKIENYLSEIYQESTSQILGYETICQNNIKALIILIFRIINADANEIKSKITSEICKDIKNYIEKNYTTSINLQDIADNMYLSPYYLSHIFKQELGESPINYMINCRINEAKSLLVTSSKLISEIASIVGYENAQYFTMLFKKRTGKSPGQYRKENKIDF